jgi:hypothetical protein
MSEGEGDHDSDDDDDDGDDDDDDVPVARTKKRMQARSSPRRWCRRQRVQRRLGGLEREQSDVVYLCRVEDSALYVDAEFWV